eukprot:scaffold6985_cov139-Skeletonema_menzelii.AAC.2
MSTPILLKWGKNSLNLTIHQGMTGSDLKQIIQSLTNVPPIRQKILCPKLWKGALKDTDVITPNNGDDGIPDNIKITLIGTADKLIEKSIDERPRFVEDMSEEEIWRLNQTNNNRGHDNDDNPIIDIIALQKEHGMQRVDGKMEMYEYNRLVTGLPQHQIEDMLRQRMEPTEKEMEQTSIAVAATNNANSELKGELVMTMGLQLRRAYVNSIAVLDNGTLVSGLDDGHVQFWRRGEMIHDKRHTGGCVNEIVVFPSLSSGVGDDDDDRPAFATAGDGSICLWTRDGNQLLTLPCFPGTTVASITVGMSNNDERDSSVYLAACFRITRQTDPNQFRLPPQNESERRRREAAEMQEQMIQNQLMDVTRRVKVWMYNASESNNGRVMFRDELIVPHDAEERAPSTAKLVDMTSNLVCGDETGLQIFDATRGRRFQKKLSLQFQHLCDIECMEPLHNEFLAVSISKKSSVEISIQSSAVRVQVPIARGVYIFNTVSATVRAVLDGHRDRVTCIRPLPDGTLLTAGGKFDATVQLWNVETLSKATKSRDEGDEITIFNEPKQMKQPGYVFDLKVLPDHSGSAVFAIAAARYNTINILI